MTAKLDNKAGNKKDGNGKLGASKYDKNKNGQDKASTMVKMPDSMEIFCHHKGDGDELIVFLHAVGGDHSSWTPQIEALSKIYTCIAPDFRGHSRSKLPKTMSAAQEATIHRFAQDTIALIEKSEFTRAHLVGLSMGGVVALEVYRLRPDLVQSLALSNTWAFHDEGAKRTEFITEQLQKKSMPESSAELIPGLFAPGTAADIIAEAVKVEGAKDKEVFLSSWKSMFQVDFSDLVKTISVPMLLIGGSLDWVTPTEPLLTRIAAAVSTAQLKNIEGAGHFSNLDHPQEYTNSLIVHLRRAGSQSGTRKLPRLGEPKHLAADTVAHAVMRMLNERGVDTFFSNSGTDFTPIIDALARYHTDEEFTLETVVAPHENTAIAMAHGYFLLTRRPQAVMAHVNVGTANMGLGLINANRSRIPMLVMAGKTPWYDGGMDGCRTNLVQWGQDTYDQGAYFREFTKWDYELKGPHQLETVIDRALATAKSDPAGPSYLILPKEPLCMPLDGGITINSQPRQKPAYLGCAPQTAIDSCASLVANARKPLILTAEAGRYSGAVEALVRLAERFAIPVIEFGKRNFFNFPTTSNLHLGFNPGKYVEEADLIISVENYVPWIPEQTSITRPATSIHIGVDPLCQNVPMRDFPVDLALVGNAADTLSALYNKLMVLESENTGEAPLYTELSRRREHYSNEHRRLFEAASASAKSEGAKKKISKTYLSYCIGQAIDDEVVIFNEYNLDPMLVPRHVPDTWFENSAASGLGWSLGAALGAQLASPSQTMMVTLGDGTYMFNTPLSAHHTAASYKLPVVIVVFNDSAWSTIKKSYKGTTPNGWAQKNNHMPLCDFNIGVDFEKLAESVGGVGIRVDKPSELMGKLKGAIETARTSRTHVLVNVVCERDG